MEEARVLGEGSYGKVSLVKNSNAFPNGTHHYLAKKTSPIEYDENLHKEIRILSHFADVPNIVKCINPSLEFESIGGLRVCSFYLEYASKGTLSHVIEQSGGRLRENDARCCTHMILEGLKPLHKEGYVHCDLKADNILAFPSRVVGRLCELKIADFGSAKEPHECGLVMTRACRGTPRYMSPESMGPRGRVVSGMDIWSLGCVVLEMFGVNEAVEDDGFFRWTVPEDISEMAKDFVSKCMAVSPSERWSAEWLTRHPFVAQRARR